MGIYMKTDNVELLLYGTANRHAVDQYTAYNASGFLKGQLCLCIIPTNNQVYYCHEKQECTIMKLFNNTPPARCIDGIREKFTLSLYYSIERPARVYLCRTSNILIASGFEGSWF